MMIKANGEYLDFNGDIEIESQIKLFEEIDKSSGSFSYDLDFADNGLNRKILGIPRADTIKSIYQSVPSEVVDDTGQSVYIGKLQVNRIDGGRIISTFFAGNTEWFSLLSNSMSSLPLYKYDIDLTEANIVASWSEDSGIVFPLIDTGVLITRSYKNVKIEDFTSCFYVKTLFKEIFNPLGIKIEGDLINDPLFNQSVIASNGKSQGDIDDRSSYVSKTSVQAGITTVETKVTFQDETTFPYFDGSLNNFTSSTYTADVRMTVRVELVLNITAGVLSAARIRFYKNAVEEFSYVAGVGGAISTSKSLTISLEAGDTIEIYALESNGIGSISVDSGSIKITPTYLYKVFGNSSVPIKWTQGEFVSNILRLLNVLPSFNVVTQTLTLDLFNRIKEKPLVDVSDQIVIDTVDFSEFVSSYAKNNIFKYQESEDEDLRVYNISNFISYGSGNLTIDNDYLEISADIIESDFTSPITYLNGIFDMSMERINFVQTDEIDSLTVTSVTDATGIASINITTPSTLFSIGNLVKVKTAADIYNGEWVIESVGAGFITVKGGYYSGNDTGTATLLKHTFTDDDNIYVFVNVPNVDTTFFSSKLEFLLEDDTPFNTTAIAYFNLLSNNTSINRVYKQSLSFGAVDNMLSYQLTLLQSYWPLFSRILNDPVMLLATGYFKRKTYDEIKTFLRPLMVKTEETVNLYYMNRLIGYKGSERGCEAQLIKLN